jgi:hypothetical protein
MDEPFLKIKYSPVKQRNGANCRTDLNEFAGKIKLPQDGMLKKSTMPTAKNDQKHERVKFCLLDNR